MKGEIKKILSIFDIKDQLYMRHIFLNQSLEIKRDLKIFYKTKKGFQQYFSLEHYKKNIKEA